MHHSKHWLSSFALQGVDQVAESLNLLSNNRIIRVSDMHLEYGRFSLLLVSRAIASFRKNNDNLIEIFRLDYPGHNYSEMIKISLEEPESYTNIKDCYTYFTKGPFTTRMHPDNSVNLFIASHILTGITVRASAPDTFFPSTSQDESTRNMRRMNAIQDLVSFLKLRHEELCEEGRIYFDVMGKTAGKKCFSKFLDRVLFRAIELGILSQDNKFSYRTHMWEKDEIFQALNELENKFEVVSYKQTEVPMPQYEEFLQDQDVQKYSENFQIFWKKALEFSLKFHYKDFYSNEEYSSIIQKLLKLISEEFNSDPPECVNFSHHLVLKKS